MTSPTSADEPGSQPSDRWAIPAWLVAASNLALRLLLVALALGLVGAVVLRLRLIVIPIVAATFITTLLEPPAAFLKRHGWPPALAATTVVVVALLAGLGLAAWIVPRFSAQLGDLRASVSDSVDQLHHWLVSGPLHLSEDQISGAVESLRDRIAGSDGSVLAQAVTGAQVAVEVVAVVFTTGILTFFFVKDGDRFGRVVLSFVPGRRREEVAEAGRRAWSAVSGYTRGITIEAAAEATLKATGLYLLGVPLVVPLAVITFFAAYIPLVGAVLAGALAGLVALVTKGPWTALAVVGLGVGIQQVTNHLLDPFIMSRSVRLHPAVVVIVVATGGIVAGVFGAVVAVPIAAIVAAVLRYERERTDWSGHGDADADAASASAPALRRSSSKEAGDGWSTARRSAQPRSAAARRGRTSGRDPPG